MNTNYVYHFARLCTAESGIRRGAKRNNSDWTHACFNLMEIVKKPMSLFLSLSLSLTHTWDGVCQRHILSLHASKI